MLKSPVALFTRAWIEIFTAPPLVHGYLVALFTRAWIEIFSSICLSDLTFRRPLHEGVDWNVDGYRTMCNSAWSPSSRGRGLKSSIPPTTLLKPSSPSSRGRGLKFLISCQPERTIKVALFTRAWIEIIELSKTIAALKVALFTRAWIEMSRHHLQICLPLVALFTRAWIEIYCWQNLVLSLTVALFTRAWIEILDIITQFRLLWSPSSRGRGLKYVERTHSHIITKSPSSRGRGLKSAIRTTWKNLSVSPSSRGRGLK